MCLDTFSRTRRGCFGNHLLLRRVRIFVPLRSVHNKRHWRFAPLLSLYKQRDRKSLSSIFQIF